MPLYVYIIYLLDLLVPLISIVGLIIAYVYRDGNNGFENSHFRFQIRTFWILLIYSIISFVTMIIIVGYLLGFITVIWFIIRCIKGIKEFSSGKEVENVTRWGF